MQVTEIGKSVNVLRKHVNKDIRLLARTLIEYVSFLEGGSFCVIVWADENAN